MDAAICDGRVRFRNSPGGRRVDAPRRLVYLLRHIAWNYLADDAARDRHRDSRVDEPAENLFVAQAFDWIESRRADCGNHSTQNSHYAENHRCHRKAADVDLQANVARL